MSINQMLTSCELFNELSEGEISKFLNNGRVIKYENNQIILKKDEGIEGIYIVLEGNSRIISSSEEKAMLYRDLKKLDVIYEKLNQSLFCKNMAFIADSELDLFFISSEEFYSFFKKSPDIFGIVMNNLMMMMIKNLKPMNELIQRIYFTNLENSYFKIRTPIIPERSRKKLNNMRKGSLELLDDSILRK